MWQNHFQGSFYDFTLSFSEPLILTKSSSSCSLIFGRCVFFHSSSQLLAFRSKHALGFALSSLFLPASAYTLLAVLSVLCPFVLCPFRRTLCIWQLSSAMVQYNGWLMSLVMCYRSLMNGKIYSAGYQLERH
ncbi:hypothetical protein VIGAN_01094800 [Vigna angularis var. angularis]|uniref:Uncharacterized protein n=1 Tax=Vigna angularis var. angularis TaxID=157739 RepID=A0A0S3QYP4_PHAAN|nr:hypothetical protein VIGAN_01094800 [Vigna angularis var. angularis]